MPHLGAHVGRNEISWLQDWVMDRAAGGRHPCLKLGEGPMKRFDRGHPSVPWVLACVGEYVRIGLLPMCWQLCQL